VEELELSLLRLLALMKAEEFTSKVFRKKLIKRSSASESLEKE
jgi:hypothetical protein